MVLLIVKNENESSSRSTSWIADVSVRFYSGAGEFECVKQHDEKKVKRHRGYGQAAERSSKFLSSPV